MRAKILVVDDEVGPRESLRMILNLDHDVRLASSGPQALEMIKEERPDVVFLDIRMPHMDGTEVLRRIKQMAPEVEVAMITAYGTVSTAQNAIRLGALDYITKPFSTAEVREVVTRALARRREQQEQQELMRDLSETIARLSDQLSEARVRDEQTEQGALLRGLTSAHSSIEDQLNEVLRLSSIGEVAAEVAHDLNNFLSTILFRIEIMLLDVDQNQTVDAAQLVDGLRQIALAARDRGEALERISMLAKSNPYEPNAMVDLNQILQEAAELSQGRVDKPERHRIIYQLGDLPAVQGSPAGLRTVFTNLIINAHHAIPGEGTITLRTFAQDRYVSAQVVDDGVGMTPDVIARLKEPFFTTKGEAGTGLGLTVAHKVIEQHHGRITFDSVPGQGTTVTVTLPVSQDQVADHDSLQVAQATPAAPPEPSPPPQPARVLIVDDHPGVLRVTAAALQAEGFEVNTTRSPVEALALFERTEAGEPLPDVVITDLRMPELPGGDLVTRIRTLAPNTAIVVVSAYLEEASEADLSRADAFLAKPCNMQDLVATVRRLTQQRAVPEGS